MSANLSFELACRLLDQMPEAAYYVDCDCRVMHWNTAAERLTGFPADTVVGNWCRETLPQKTDERGVVFCGDNCPGRCAMIDGRLRHEDLFINHRDGRRLAIAVRTSPVRDEGGSIIGAIIIVTPRAAAA